MTDAEIVAEIQRGRNAAEATLYDRYAERVWYVALRRLRVRADAEDVRSETFLRVIQALRQGKLRTPAALPGFVLETARNVIRERVRQDARWQALDADAPGQAASLAVDPLPCDPIARRALERTIADMRPRERAFLRLYYFEDLSKAEISRRLGIKEDRVRLIKSRTLKRFRECFDK